jgi:futalosine hydrolase
MRVLIVSATASEIDPLVVSIATRAPVVRPAHKDRETRALRAPNGEPMVCTYHGSDLDIVVTGVGMVATAVWTSRALLRSQYDLALNFGVCGSFDPRLAPGTVVHVITDEMPELGAEDGESFLTLRELGLPGDDEPPLSHGRLVNETPPHNAALTALPTVRGITVNTVHGNPQSIEAIRQRSNPDVESMEGAAFMYACLVHGVPFAQVRAVSNIVERRNRGAWKLPEAIERLHRAALDILDHV